MRYLLFFYLLLSAVSLHASAVPSFQRMENSRDVVFFLSTKRSGSNWVSASLSAITRKPISWLSWRESIFDPKSERRNHPSYNRLKLPLVSDQPLMYRTHFLLEDMKRAPSSRNKLIFVSRNPKELLFRQFFLARAAAETPSWEFLEEFFSDYLAAFEAYDQWHPENRVLVFYEDFIGRSDEILLELLEFMGEKPTYYADFLANKEKYTAQILAGYKKQHTANLGGASSEGGAKTLFYTRNVDPECLRSVDRYLQAKSPRVWELYLRRFEEK